MCLFFSSGIERGDQRLFMLLTSFKPSNWRAGEPTNGDCDAKWGQERTGWKSAEVGAYFEIQILWKHFVSLLRLIWLAVFYLHAPNFFSNFWSSLIMRNTVVSL